MTLVERADNDSCLTATRIKDQDDYKSTQLISNVKAEIQGLPET
jgi:hypothetical protein